MTDKHARKINVGGSFMFSILNKNKMSRIGNKIIEIPENVNFSFKDQKVVVSCGDKSMSIDVCSNFEF